MSSCKGIVQVYTGNGKGKTTAAMGQALRMLGHGYRVTVIQFMKGRESGEKKAAEKWLPGLKVYSYGRKALVDRRNPSFEDTALVQEGMGLARRVMLEDRTHMLILDEINVAVDFGLASEQQLVDLIAIKPGSMDLVLTGRNASPRIIELADLVSEIKEIKHPFNSGACARKGIEW